MSSQFAVIVRVKSFLPSRSKEYTVVDGAEDWYDRSEYIRTDCAELFHRVYAYGRYELVELPSGASNLRNVEVQDSTLNDSALEQRPRLVGGGVHVAQNVRGTRRRSEEGDVRRVAAKVRDEAVDPLKRFPLVPEAIVANAHFACSLIVFAERGTCCKAEQTQAVAKKYETRIPDGSTLSNTYLNVTSMMGFPTIMLLCTRAPPSYSQLDPEPRFPPLLKLEYNMRNAGFGTYPWI